LTPEGTALEAIHLGYYGFYDEIKSSGASNVADSVLIILAIEDIL